jgi:carbamoyltransferase
MYLGISFGHDCSVSIHDLEGGVIYAISEERLNRIKGYWGFPNLALAHIFSIFDPREIKKVFLSGHSEFRKDNFQVYNYLFSTNPDNHFDLANSKIPVGWFNQYGINDLMYKPKSDAETISIINNIIEVKLSSFGIKADYSFVNHHNSHAATAIVGSGYESTLVLTLDGEGDFESGTVQIYDRGKITNVARFPRSFSLGGIYSEATARYGFKKNRHEGKLTGLSSFLSESKLDFILKNYINTTAGTIKFEKLEIDKFSDSDLYLYELISNHDYFGSDYLGVLLDVIALNSTDYSELAYVAQTSLENSVLSLLQFYLEEYKITNIALAGGVFANVKLNNSIADLPQIENVYVYPNMGDGGLSVGGVWDYFIRNFKKPKSHANLFLGPSNKLIDNNLYNSYIPIIIDNLNRGNIVGLFEGRSEWGPRALCHRSILANPSFVNMSNVLNTRLARTEFMPFAPVTLREYSKDVFDINFKNHVSNLQNMVTTTRVKNGYLDKIKASVHVDGTARPQIIDHEIGIINPLLETFYRETGIPALLNTSFNVHEEPIVENEEQALNAFSSGRIDVLVTPSGIQTK